MASIDVAPVVLRDCEVTIDGNDYASSCAGVTFTPTTPTVEWGGMTPDSSFTFPGRTTWVCAIDYAQDLTTAESLTRFLHDHEGETIAGVHFAPVTGEPGVTANLVIAPGAIGGAGNAVATSSVSLGVKGKPVLDPVV